MLLTIFLFKVPDHLFSKVWCSLDIHSFEQYLECTAIAMALTALTVEADDYTNSPEFHRLVAVCSTVCGTLKRKNGSRAPILNF